jgi:tRNA threonylcarbamoyl adenosine modification protein YjeE
VTETVALPDIEATRALAQRLAPTLKRGDVLALSGALGTGKTTFAQYLIRTLSDEAVEVTSPTFTLVQSYPVRLADGSPCELYHYDLYRVRSPHELTELGLDEAFAHLTLIEWPERLADGRGITLALSFALAEDGARTVTIARPA